MKRTLLVASCALLASCLLSSCQKEEKSIIELTRELTAELREINDLPSANARAPRVEVLNKRFQDARVRVLALNSTSLYRGAGNDDAHQGADYAAVLKALAREVGRVRASYPSSTHDGEVDKDRLLVAIADAQGEKGSVEERKAAGQRYLEDESGTHETPGNFAEYYGSAKLREALAYRSSAPATSNLAFDSDAAVPAVPALSESTGSDASAPAADDAEPDTSSADEDDSSSDDEDEE